MKVFLEVLRISKAARKEGASSAEVQYSKSWPTLLELSTARAEGFTNLKQSKCWGTSVKQQIDLVFVDSCRCCIDCRYFLYCGRASAPDRPKQYVTYRFV
jgi:hypothetical protein